MTHDAMSMMDADYYYLSEEEESALFSGWSIEDLFYYRDLKRRKLFIRGEILAETVGDAIRHIMQINKEDEGIPPEDRKPILLYISSYGGNVDAGYELINVISASKTPVYTINTGFAYSMAFLISLAGHKRYCYEHSKYLMHDGSNFIYDSSAKVQDFVEFEKKAKERTKRFVLSKSSLSSEEYDNKLRVEWYLFADEAKSFGFVDYIIGQDCELGEVI